MHISSKPRSPLRERVLLIIFSTLFLHRVVNTLNQFPERFKHKPSLINDFGITEWFTNYAGGFVRRGLPGSLLHWLYVNFGIAPDWVAVLVSIICYALLFVCVLRRSIGILPVWGLFTSPLLASLVYMNDTIIRKDALILLILFFSMGCIFKQMASLSSVVLSIVLPLVGVLSHEIFIFLFFPSAFLFVGMNLLFHLENKRTSVLKLCCLLPSLGAAFGVLTNYGNYQQAIAIKSSWQSFFGNPPPPGIGRAMFYWLQSREGGQVVAANWKYEIFRCKYFSITYGFSLVILLVAAIFLVSFLFYRSENATLFIMAFSIQLIAMLPVFIYGIDQGRWVVFCLNSALIIVLQLSSGIRNRLVSIFPSDPWKFASGHERLCSFIAPIGLGFWSLPHAGWESWFSCSPFGSVLSQLGVPGPLQAAKALLRFL